MSTSKNADWVMGLRDLADWLEQNPAVDIVRLPTITRLSLDLDGQDVEAFALRHGLAFTRQEPRLASRTETVYVVECSKTFGPVTVEARRRSVVRKRTLADRIKAVFA